MLARLGRRRVQGIVLDLGLSSLQIDDPERGFAYAYDAPLDMRMGRQELTAAAVVNTYAKADLARILRSYGEERFADRIAGRIVAERAREPFTTSGRLVRLLSDAVPMKSQRSGGHPAKRTFQALRIEVNGELAALESLLPDAVAALAVGGRIAVLAYHSLEDRLVKQLLAAGARDRAPRDLPVVPPDLAPELRLLTRGAQAAHRRRGQRQPPGGIGPAAGGRAHRGTERRMSALWQGLVAPPAKTRPRLRPVADPTPRLARFPFLLVMIGIFGLGMAGLLMLNTTLQNQAFEARALNRQATELAYVQADLERQLDLHVTPGELARVASKLGMRPDPHPAFLVLPEGRVVGEPTPVTGDAAKSLVVKTPEQIAAEKAAAGRQGQGRRGEEGRGAEGRGGTRRGREEEGGREEEAATGAGRGGTGRG